MRRGALGQPRPYRAADAPSRHPRDDAPPFPGRPDSNQGLPIAGNLLNQTFLARRPNEIWRADISCIPTDKSWLYLAIVLDLGTRKLASWARRDHLRQELTIAALTMALQRQRPGRGGIHHSDRGSQYAATDDR